MPKKKPDHNKIEPDHAIELPQVESGDLLFKHNVVNGQPLPDKGFEKVTEPEVQHPARPTDGEVEVKSKTSSSLKDALNRSVGKDNIAGGITDEEVDFVATPEPVEIIPVPEPPAVYTEPTYNRYRDIMR